MSRGRRPKKTAAKKIAGNPGRRKPRKLPPAIAEDCPGWLDPIGQEEWRRLEPKVRPLFGRPGVSALFAGYCQAWAELQLATRAVRKEEYGAHQRQKSAFQVLRSYAAELARLEWDGAAEGDELGQFLESG